MLLGLDNLFAVFRRVPSSQTEFTIVTLDEFDSDSVRFHEVYGMNFGLKTAPLQFNRVAEFLCAVAACLEACLWIIITTIDFSAPLSIGRCHERSVSVG